MADSDAGSAQHKIVLCHVRDERGSQYEEATVRADGSVHVTGEDAGARVSDFFGDDVTSYEWTWIVAPERVPALVLALGGAPHDDVLALLASYHRSNAGVLAPLMNSPEIAARFSNWHGLR